MQRAISIVFSAALALAMAGCGVGETIDCIQVCGEIDECNEIDETDCIDQCEDATDLGETFETALEACEDCLDQYEDDVEGAPSCEEINTCSDECAQIISISLSSQ